MPRISLTSSSSIPIVLRLQSGSVARTPLAILPVAATLAHSCGSLSALGVDAPTPLALCTRPVLPALSLGGTVACHQGQGALFVQPQNLGSEHFNFGLAVWGSFSALDSFLRARLGAGGWWQWGGMSDLWFDLACPFHCRPGVWLPAGTHRRTSLCCACLAGTRKPQSPRTPHAGFLSCLSGAAAWQGSPCVLPWSFCWRWCFGIGLSCSGAFVGARLKAPRPGRWLVGCSQHPTGGSGGKRRCCRAVGRLALRCGACRMVHSGLHHIHTGFRVRVCVLHFPVNPSGGGGLAGVAAAWPAASLLVSMLCMKLLSPLSAPFLGVCRTPGRRKLVTRVCRIAGLSR